MPAESLTPPAAAAQRLILATKVIRSPIFGPNGDRIGHIEDVALEKTGGKVAYAIAAFGDFLGMGGKYTPMPWSELTYDPDKSGYRVRLSREQLREAPSYEKEDLADIGDDLVWVFI